MSDEQEGVTLKDLEFEAAGTEKAAAARDAFFRQTPTARRTREIQVSASSVSAAAAAGRLTGGRLIDRRPVPLQKRYETLCRTEAQFSPSGDHAFLISPACGILERELDELLVTPVRGVAGRLAAAMGDSRKDREKAGLLEAWVSGSRPATLGTVSLILLALRRGQERKTPDITEFLNRNFRPDFIGLLASNRLAPCLDRIRDRYRNPACHGFAMFDAASYEAFVRLAAGNRRFADWDRRGPEPAPPPGDAGFLHHLLAQLRLLPEQPLPPAPGPAALLTALTAPRSASLAVEVVPYHADAGPRSRGVSVEAARADRPFRLNDSLRLTFRADRDCYVTLIDVGASGTVSVILPNAWRTQARIAGGKPHFVPDVDAPEFQFTLAGDPGRERVVALATLGPPPIALAPDSGAPFRVLRPAEVEVLAATVAELDPASWGAAACEFEIRE